MRIRMTAGLLAAGAMVLTSAVVTGPAAQAKDRPCGRPVMTSGTTALGTPWTLKSQYDDDGTPPHTLVAGEEFEIATPAAGQVWSVAFSDNGTEFFRNDNDVSTATGIREVHPNPIERGTTNHMAVHAVRKDASGQVIEVIDGSVDLAPVPARCGGH